MLGPDLETRGRYYRNGNAGGSDNDPYNSQPKDSRCKAVGLAHKVGARLIQLFDRGVQFNYSLTKADHESPHRRSSVSSADL